MSDRKIIPVNSSDGFTLYLIGFYVDTEHGWVGAHDKRAIESLLAAARDAALEEAAKIATRLASASQDKCCERRSLRIANEIRALKEARDE